jgi:hypothetical protein
MTNAERQACERLARNHRAATGFPLFVPRPLFDRMVAERIDTSNVQILPRLPVAA